MINNIVNNCRLKCFLEFLLFVIWIGCGFGFDIYNDFSFV